MASNYTSNYNLCQWEPDDPVCRTEFNEDNAKIDAAIKAVDSRVDGVSSSKASASALTALKNTVSFLSSTVSSQGATLGHKGNCQIAVSSYTGNGKNSRTLSFEHQPVFLVIASDTMIFAARGAGAVHTHGGGNYLLDAAWSGNSVTLSYTDSSTSNRAFAVGNDLGTAYQVVALLNMDQ